MSKIFILSQAVMNLVKRNFLGIVEKLGGWQMYWNRLEAYSAYIGHQISVEDIKKVVDLDESVPEGTNSVCAACGRKIAMTVFTPIPLGASSTAR